MEIGIIGNNFFILLKTMQWEMCLVQSKDRGERCRVSLQFLIKNHEGCSKS